MGSQVQTECEPIKRSPLLNVLMEVFCMVLDLVKVLTLGIPVLLITAVRILVPSKPKSIRGQTVLVKKKRQYKIPKIPPRNLKFHVPGNISPLIPR